MRNHVGTLVSGNVQGHRAAAILSAAQTPKSRVGCCAGPPPVASVPAPAPVHRGGAAPAVPASTEASIEAASSSSSRAVATIA